MKLSRNHKNTLLLLFPLVYVFVYKIYLYNNFTNYISAINASVFLILASISIQFLGFRQTRKAYMGEKIKQIVSIFLLVFFVLSHGAYYLQNGHLFTEVSLIKNIIIPIIAVTALEIFRYVILSANKDKKKIKRLTTLVLIILEIALTIKNINISNYELVIKLLITMVLPIIAKNLALSYLSVHSGFELPIIYIVLIDIIQFIPDISSFVNSLIKVILPILLLFYSKKFINLYENGVKRNFAKEGLKVYDGVVLSLFVVGILFFNGFFGFQALGIATGSMEPELEVGDLVIVKNLNKKTKLKKGDIILFRDHKIKVVHRIVEIKTTKDRECYVTKGDRNNVVDTECVDRKDILGKIEYSIPKIAYPAVYLSDITE